MDEHEIKKIIDKFFGDTSRSARATREGLEDIIEHCEMLKETIPKNAD